ncbi:hypothetical protein [Mesonia aquimarina]|uniref:hypothetical protein n=1 Tax=Mesonia aquimarina TaxID=1504967 RepID=UPI0013CE9FCC|nr:hypothetical protein [Mesonia aquimarina]
MSQETFFSGKIYADSINTTQINIVNLSQEIGSVNKIDGAFSIAANTGDEVIFSSVQYQPYQLTITKEMLEKENKVFLFLEVNQLKEVKLSNIDLTGDLTKDAKNVDTYVFDPRSVGLPRPKPKLTTAQRRIKTPTTGSGLVSVDHIINSISGRLAMLWRQREYEIEKNWVQKGLEQFPPSFFTEELEIPAAFHEDFMYFCLTKEGYKNFVTHNKLELIKFFKKQTVAYKKFKEWDK